MKRRYFWPVLATALILFGLTVYAAVTAYPYALFGVSVAWFVFAAVLARVNRSG